MEQARRVRRPLEIRIGRRGIGKSIFVGEDNPLRIVAPFGFSSKRDISDGIHESIAAFAAAGADAVQELSTIGPYSVMRMELINSSPVPYGSVLAYEFIDRCRQLNPKTENEVKKILLDVVNEQIKQGIDYTTVHASVSSKTFLETSMSRTRRAIPIPSRAAAMLITLMEKLRIDNPLNTYFDLIVDACREGGVTISLGAGFRPASISDACDEVHLVELKTQSKLTEKALANGASLMLEGLSHGIPKDIDEYVRLAKDLCYGIPVTALGPLPVDIAVGMDHIAAAIGVTFGSLSGLSLVNVISSKEHIAMPTRSDIVEAIRAAKVGAYVAEVIKAGKGSSRDRNMSIARRELDWHKQLQYALFPELLTLILDRTNIEDGQPCSICASKCPLITQYNLIEEVPS